jgi:hypothetical protein
MWIIQRLGDVPAAQHGTNVFHTIDQLLIREATGESGTCETKLDFFVCFCVFGGEASLKNVRTKQTSSAHCLPSSIRSFCGE